MESIAVGATSYMIVYSFMIYYKMIVKHEERNWLKTYIPASIITFMIFIFVIAKFF